MNFDIPNVCAGKLDFDFDLYRFPCGLECEPEFIEGPAKNTIGADVDTTPVTNAHIRHHTDHHTAEAVILIELLGDPVESLAATCCRQERSEKQVADWHESLRNG